MINIITSSTSHYCAKLRHKNCLSKHLLCELLHNKPHFNQPVVAADRHKSVSFSSSLVVAKPSFTMTTTGRRAAPCIAIKDTKMQLHGGDQALRYDDLNGGWVTLVWLAGSAELHSL